MIHAFSLAEVQLQDGWVTVGVFDGVHRGHQSILQRLVAGAHQEGAAAAVVTFWPHPAEVLTRQPLKSLTLPEERAEWMASLGVDVLVTHPFNRRVANLSARTFMERLKRHLGLKRLLMGYDFALGRGREGNAARLSALGSELGYTVEVVEPLSDESGVISSTSIRKLVSVGEVAEAARLLGHPYSLHGRVVRGDGRGRQIHFPTANIDYPEEKLLPANGIYVCTAWLSGVRYAAAVNIGTRPTFQSEARRPIVEAYLLDFDHQIYGEDLKLEFIVRLRDELKFASLEALIEQMHQDVAMTRRILQV